MALIQNIFFFYFICVFYDMIISIETIGGISGNNSVFLILVKYLNTAENSIAFIDAVHTFQSICFSYDIALTCFLIYNGITFFESAFVYIIGIGGFRGFLGLICDRILNFCINTYIKTEAFFPDFVFSSIIKPVLPVLGSVAAILSGIT